MAGTSPDATPAPIRIREHTLIDICDLLDATFTLDGEAVSFVCRSRGVRREWNGRLGDWLVADAASWRIVPDAEFGRAQAGSPTGGSMDAGAASERAASEAVPKRRSALTS